MFVVRGNVVEIISHRPAYRKPVISRLSLADGETRLGSAFKRRRSHGIGAPDRNERGATEVTDADGRFHVHANCSDTDELGARVSVNMGTGEN